MNRRSPPGRERLVAALAARARTVSRRFEETLACKRSLLDTEARAEARDRSDDGFLYARCAVVVRGPAYHASALADPPQMPADLDF